MDAAVFSSWGLSEVLLKSLEAMKFENPTPVQAAVIPHLLAEGGDVTVLAKTGTGKTAAFGIPLAEKLEREPRIQALVLCPTRELAAQVARQLADLGRGKGLHVTSILGGESYRRQIESLRRGPQIVVSTPGRLVDLLEQKLLDLSGVKFLVLDEADEMLSFGFQDALKAIRQSLSGEGLATWLFSATMSPSVQRLTQDILREPKTFSLSAKAEPLKIESFAAVVYEEDKEKALSLLLRAETDFYGIIFAQTKKQVADLEYRLNSMGMAVESLHGDKPQMERNKVLDRLRRREARVLVATDVAARGLDIQDLTHVVNFEIPWDVETFTHRVGRTARAGKSGTVWTLVRPKEAQTLRKFERALNIKFQNLKIPKNSDVTALQARALLQGLLGQTVDETQKDFFGDVVSEFAKDKELTLSEETREWMVKYLRQSGLSVQSSRESEPRTFELRTDAGPGGPRRDVSNDRQRGFSQNRGGGFRNDRGFGGDRRSFGNDRGFGGGGDRRSFGGDNRRSFNSDDREGGGGFGGERRSFNNDRGSFPTERRSFGNDRGFGGAGDRPAGGPGERRGFVRSNDRAAQDGERRSFAPRRDDNHRPRNGFRQHGPRKSAES